MGELVRGWKLAWGLGVALACATPGEAETRQWTTRVESLTIGSGGESVDLRDLRSTCNPLTLTLALSAGAPQMRKCLPEGETRRVSLEIEAGTLVSSRVEPDDAIARCVVEALAKAPLGSLTCAFEADASR
jgi:hypothetical protein